MAWVKVAALEDIPEEGGHVVRIEDEPFAIFRTETGAYCAIENACPHMGLPLHTSKLSGNIVTCTHHGLPFDVETGKCTRFAFYSLKRFDAKAEDGAIWLDI
ncbi:MAG: Rieske 2Fe-2S domain-containing protein [Alphaproteobacteria bacterium]|nr:Rieske 2Fe-2S domain-containing protein [Alphaproteobacteria bacterium]